MCRMGTITFGFVWVLWVYGYRIRNETLNVIKIRNDNLLRRGRKVHSKLPAVEAISILIIPAREAGTARSCNYGQYGI